MMVFELVNSKFLRFRRALRKSSFTPEHLYLNLKMDFALSKLCSDAYRPVASSPHNRLNCCQGTIFCSKLLGVSPKYFVKKLNPQHVAKMYRFRSKVNGTL